MTDQRITNISWPIVVVLALALASFTPATSAQDIPLDFEVSGDAGPGGTVTVTASTTDGSTIESISWSQVGGVDATLSGATANPVTVMFGAESAYKAELIHVLEEPPITADQLPPNVPPPEGEFHGGQQDRFEVLGVNPFALEETGLVMLEADVVTSSGMYMAEAEVHTTLRWQVASGISNVPVDLPVLLHGKEQASYDWMLTPPAGSSATLMDSGGQNAEFTPDVMGQYAITVTDLETGDPVTLVIYAGSWQGVIVGQDAGGRPVPDSACTNCHNGSIAPDAFTPWAQTGHAEIFTNNLDTSTHYGDSCFACHTVGFNPAGSNGGFDDAPDYQAFLDAGLLNNPGDNWTTMLAQFPMAARLANIQCEDCHGPQVSPGHTQGAPRQNLSANVCATCHGEPLRHARFQQWQLSAHANYELAVEEGQDGTCSKCHTGNGFLAWLPVLDGTVPGDPGDDVEVTWTEDETHPQTCQTCHDPHAIGTTSGDDPNATVRISGDTPLLLAGFVAEDVGRGAICMTCHNTRRGLRNDSTWDGTSDKERAPHRGAQTDVLMGQNVYLMEVGDRSYHSLLDDSCATCHMEETPPPPDLAYNGGGTNHTFYASPEICSNCHSVIMADDVQGPVEMMLEEIHHQLVDAWEDVVDGVLAAGNTIDLNGDATVVSAGDVEEIEFSETRGRQALVFTLSDAMTYGPYRMGDIDVVPPEGDPYAIWTAAPGDLVKAGWNFLLIEADGSLGVHNPSFVEDVLETTEETLDGIIGGVVGGSANAVACTTDFVYWTEIAARLLGSAGSVWRTDVVARNTADAPAAVEFNLHADSMLFTGTGAIDPGAQGVFEDIVDQIGADGEKGALEICSDQPLEVIARIYNVSDIGTFGQFLDGIDYSGLGEGDDARLYGLRQMEGEFRTNISVTNTGSETAEVMITLYDTVGTELHSYTLSVGSGMALQDLEPFRTRAGAPTVGWGFAVVEVVSGSGIVTSASVVDSRTNDATTIPPKT